MLSSFIKRGYLAASPWVFGQRSLPEGFSQSANDPLINSILFRKREGFIYAFNSIIDAYCAYDLETLKNCMEGSLFAYVKQGLSDLAKENIQFKRLHENNPTLIPIDFSIISGVSIDRSKNPHSKNVSSFTLGDKNNLTISMVEKMLGSVIPTEMSPALKKSKIYYGAGTTMSILGRIDIGFEGKNFIGLFKDNEELTSKYNSSSYHILRFETEIIKSDKINEITNPFDAPKKLKEMNLNSFENDWVLVDIDNQLGGNPIVKD